MSARAGWASAAVVVVAVAGILLASQPITSPWWTGGDADSVYLSSGVSLMGGRPTRYFDHPGTPLQEALAATLEARWAIAGSGSRSAQADATFRNLDSTRPYFRGWALFLYFGSALAVAAAVGLLARDWRAGGLGGLLFLGAPQVILYSIELRPDVVLGALSVGVVALLVAAVRRRSAALYLWAAALLGFSVTVKLHAAGLLLPFLVALALARPPDDWSERLAVDASRGLRKRRAVVLAACIVYLVLLVVLNLGSAGAPRAHLVSFVAAVAVVVAAAALAFRLLGRTRFRALGTLVPALVVAALAGAVLPNLFYAGAVPTMARWVTLGLLGRGVNSDASPLVSGLGALKPWIPYAILAAIGLGRALRAREWESLLWASGVAAMALLAAARFATPHYFIPAVALSIPLVLRAVTPTGRPAGALALVAAVLLLVIPVRDGIRQGRELGRLSDRSQRLNGWAVRHLAANQVALTTLPSGDTTYLAYIVQFASSPPALRYRTLPANASGIALARQLGLRVRYVVHDPATTVDAGALGVGTLEPAPGAPNGVDVVAGA